jgi:protein phosphatase
MMQTGITITGSYRTASAMLRGKPTDDRIDVYGLTHPGHKRTENADHFLVASLHRAMRVHATSLDAAEMPPMSSDSRGYLLLVADGVGGLARAKEGSAHATDAIARFLLEMNEVTYPVDAAGEAVIVERLRGFVQHVHESLREEFEQNRVGTATTITIALGMWPRAFIVHAGDSRCYRMRGGELQRLTSDQTLAQALIDAGALKPDAEPVARLKNTLVSALGSSQLEVQIVTDQLRPADQWLLCTDGLTRHVSDEEIADRMRKPGTAEQVCRDLIQLALDRGGDDNVTVICGRLRED